MKRATNTSNASFSRWPLAGLSALVLFLSLIAGPASAQQIFESTADGNWNDWTIWNVNGGSNAGMELPGKLDSVIISHRINFNVGSADTVNVLTLKMPSVSTQGIILKIPAGETLVATTAINLDGVSDGATDSLYLDVNGELHTKDFIANENMANAGALVGVHLGGKMQVVNYNHNISAKPTDGNQVTHEELKIDGNAVFTVTGSMYLSTTGYGGFPLNVAVRDNASLVISGTDLTMESGNLGEIELNFYQQAVLDLAGDFLHGSPGEVPQGKVKFNDNSTIIFSGTSTQQVIGHTTTVTGDSVIFNNVTITNTFEPAVKVSYGEWRVKGDFNFQGAYIITSPDGAPEPGLILFDTTATISNAGPNRFIDGQAGVIYPNDFTLPLGNNGTYGAIRVFGMANAGSNPVIVGQYYANQSIDDTNAGLPFTIPAPAVRYSKQEYWRIGDRQDQAQIQVELFWENSISSGITQTGSLLVAQATNGSMALRGRGTVTTNSITSSNLLLPSGAAPEYVTFAAQIFQQNLFGTDPFRVVTTDNKVVLQGESVTVTGFGFAITDDVYVGGAEANVTNATQTSITFEMPKNAGVGPINVIGGGQQGYTAQGVTRQFPTDPNGIISSTTFGTDVPFGSPVDADTATNLVVADFNRDGRLDIAHALVNLHKISVNYQNADSTFTETQLTVAAASSPTKLVAADFNNDGWMDLAYTYGSINTQVAILPNDKTGAFLAQQAVVTNGTVIDIEVIEGPTDNDHPMIVVLNDGGGMSAIAFADSTNKYELFYNRIAGESANVLAVGDFTGDNEPDLIFADAGTADISLWTDNNGDRDYSNSATTALGSAIAGPVVVTDRNMDGIPELIAGGFPNPQDFTVITFNTGTQTFEIGNTYSTSSAQPIKDISIANMDGAFGNDVIVFTDDATSGTEFIEIFLDDGTTGYDSPISNTYAGLSAITSGWVQDMSGEGFPDIMVRTSNSYGNAIIYNELNPGPPSSEPTNLVLNPFAHDKVQITVDPVYDATGYMVRRISNGGVSTPPDNYTTYNVGDVTGDTEVISMGSATTLIDSGLIGSTTYDYEVYAFNGTGFTTIFNLTPKTGTVTTPVDTLEADSLTLMAFYNQLDGANWTGISNWGITSVDQWEGVTVENGVVTRLDLFGKNLTGTLPPEMGNFWGLKYLSLSGNNIVGEIPADINNLTTLDTLNLSSNGLQGTVPDMNGMTSLQAINLSGNFLERGPTDWSGTVLKNVNLSNNWFGFNAMEAFLSLGLPVFNYANQTHPNATGDSLIAEGAYLEIANFFEAGANDQYQWFKGTDTLFGETGPSLVFNSIAVADAGAYRMQAYHPSFPGEKHNYGPYTLAVSTVQGDSSALANFYGNFDGANTWANATNWTATSDLNSWHGVTGSDSGVVALDLSYNNVVGPLTDAWPLGQMSQLKKLNLTGNELTGEMPIDWENFASLKKLSVADNQLDNIGADLALIPSLDSVEIHLNNFQFADISPLMNKFAYFKYSPMNPVAVTDSVVTLSPGDFFFLPGYFDEDSTNTQYQWMFNGASIPGATSSDFTINSVSLSDAGFYYLEATNTNVPGLTITTDSVELRVNSATLDSLVLVEFYHNLDSGQGWTNATNWLTGDLSTWFGITVSNGSVTRLELPFNNLVGDLPPVIGELRGIEVINLAGNSLTGGINRPAGWERIQSLDVSNNELVYLDSMGGTTLTNLSIANNRLEINDILINASVPNFSYDPQNPFTDDVDSLTVAGQHGIIDPGVQAPVAGTNVYTWYKDAALLGGQNDSVLEFTSIAKADAGFYYLSIENTLLPGFFIQSGNYEIKVSTLQQDSLALMVLYDSLHGDQWTNNTGWLTDSLNNWYGVTISDYSVAEVHLGNNNLSGNLPPHIANISQLQILDLSDNQIIGGVPNVWSNLGLLTELNLSGNLLTGIPNLTASGVLSALDITNNRIPFVDLVTYVGQPGVTYDPQKPLIDPVDTLLNLSDDFSVLLPAAGADAFQWVKDGDSLAGQTNPQLQIQNARFSSEGTYFGYATSSAVPGLVLRTDSVIINVSSLQRDSLVLRDFYNRTDGPNWTTQPNWATTSIQSGTWDFITIEDNRVTELTMPTNRVKGAVPRTIRDLRFLHTLNVQGNELIHIPDLSGMDSLKNLNVSGNRLPFGSLEPNASIQNFSYSDQAPLGQATDTVVSQGSPVSRTINTTGNFNTYQWYLNDVALTAETSNTLAIDSVNYEDMGNYRLEVSNTLLTDEVMETPNQRLLAFGTVAGQVTNDGTPIENGRMFLFRVQARRYDSLGPISLQPEGLYRFDSVILGNFVAVALPNKSVYPNALRTWYGDVLFWQDADTIRLRSHEDSVNIDVLGTPPATNGSFRLGGVVEEEVADSTGRIERKRRVGGATVTISREIDQGRTLETEYEVIAVTETDEEGNFEFAFLPASTYRLNVQFPGVPMDESTQIDITVGSSETDSAVSVTATVLEQGIQVSIDQVEGFGPKRDSFPILVYPNPTTSYLNVVLGKQIEGEVLLQVQDLNGRTMRSLQTRPDFNQQLRINLGEMPPGMYLLRVEQVETGAVRTTQIRIH